jgi:hypothetical protein
VIARAPQSALRRVPRARWIPVDRGYAAALVRGRLTDKGVMPCIPD